MKRGRCRVPCGGTTVGERGARAARACCAPSRRLADTPLPSLPRRPRRSITQLIFRNGKAAWAAAFPPARGWAAAPYGVSGNDVQDLMWRLGAPEGWERPARAPRVVALL